MEKITLSKEELYDLWTIQNKTLKEISAHLGVSEYVVRERKKEFGIVRAFQCKEWLFHHHVEKQLSTVRMAELANCGVDAIRDGMKKLRIPIDTYQSNQSKRKYCVNDEYFKNIDTEEKAYWFGFLMADGYVIEKGYITIGLARKDEHHITSFLKSVESNSPITQYVSNAGTPGKEHQMSKVTVCSVKLARSLTERGLKSPKSLHEFIPLLSDELYRPFLLGYYDGDGTYQYHQNKEGRWKVKSSVLGGKKMCESIQQYFAKQGIKLCIYRKKGDLYEVAGSHLLAYDFLKHLYKDATIYLPRKYEKFLQSPIKR